MKMDITVVTIYLYIIGSNLVSICSAKKCTDCPIVTLGNTNKTIKYGSKKYGCTCSWKIQSSVKIDTTVVVLTLKNITLPNPDEGCAGSIRFPATAGHDCKFEQGVHCIFYSTSNSRCQISEADINKYTSHTCDHFKKSIWENTKQIIEYNAAEKANTLKKFTLNYYPIYCTPPTTTPTTKKSSTTTPTTTSSSMTTTTKPINNEKTTGVISSASLIITESNQSRSHISSNTQSVTNPTSINGTNSPYTGDQMKVVSIALPIALILIILIIIGIMVFLRKKRTESETLRHVREEKHEMAENETVENEIYGNNDAEEPEMKMNEIYESSPFAPEEEEACVYAVVNKPRKTIKKDDYE